MDSLLLSDIGAIQVFARRVTLQMSRESYGRVGMWECCLALYEEFQASGRGSGYRRRLCGWSLGPTGLAAIKISTACWTLVWELLCQRNSSHVAHVACMPQYPTNSLNFATKL